MKRRRILIVDDHPIVRHGLRRMIDAEADLEVCAEAASEAEARAAILEQRPDALIVDLSLEHGDGFDLVREVTVQHPELPILVLSMHDETLYAERLLAAGARGYIMKQAASDQLLVALRQVLAGRLYLSPALNRVANRLAGAATPEPADPVSRLSDRELQILSLLGRGWSSREAASTLGLSVKTIESHRLSLKHKLNLDTNGQLLQYAHKWYTEQQRPAG